MTNPSTKFEHLPQETIDQICNGCGGKGGFITPPYALFFEASCNHHDYGYWKGCTEKQREICDKKFHQAMKNDTTRLNKWKQPYFRAWAYAYYCGVRIFGKKFFYYADKQRVVQLPEEITTV